jgi:hypothetical protein
MFSASSTIGQVLRDCDLIHAQASANGLNTTYPAALHLLYNQEVRAHNFYPYDDDATDALFYAIVLPVSAALYFVYILHNPSLIRIHSYEHVLGLPAIVGVAIVFSVLYYRVRRKC